MSGRSHVGEQSRTKQGLIVEIVRWVSREKVQVEILETGERQWMTYMQFRKGLIKANFFKYPSRTECSFNQAKFITIGYAALAIGTIAAILYAIFQ